MEVADFVADSEEEEYSPLDKRALLAVGDADGGDEKEFWGSVELPVAISTRSLAGDAESRQHEATEQAAASRSVVEIVGHDDVSCADGDQGAVSKAEQDVEVFGAINVDSMDVEAALGAADDEDPHGNDDDIGSDDSEREHEDQGDGSDEIVVGSAVEVEARTWPGINKQGGAGRVTAVHREMADDGQTELVLYDVRYLFGGVDKLVESEFVQLLWKVHLEAKRRSVPRDYYHGTLGTYNTSQDVLQCSCSHAELLWLLLDSLLYRSLHRGATQEEVKDGGSRTHKRSYAGATPSGTQASSGLC